MIRKGVLMIHKKPLLISILFLLSGIMGCLEDSENIDNDIDLRVAKLTENDLSDDFQKINTSEEYITDPYTVEQGKLFEGNQVQKKYEVLFIKNNMTFLNQEIAQLTSINQSMEFMETLKKQTTIPGIVTDWNFVDLSIEQIGDETIFKQTKTVIDERVVTINLLVFRVNTIIHILASGSVSQEEIISYAKIAEKRIDDLLI